MKLLWVKADKWGSKLIRWGLVSDCSHFAICFDEDIEGGGIAFHSYGTGTQLEWLETFRGKYQIVHAMETKIPLSLDEEEKVYKHILQKEAGRGYDYAGITYFALRVLWNKVTGNSGLPLRNRWQVKDMRLCTGIAPSVFEALGVDFPQGVDAEMITPTELLKIARGSSELQETTF